MANANVAFSKETLQYFAKLIELTKQPSQELAERLFKEAIDRSMVSSDTCSAKPIVDEME